MKNIAFYIFCSVLLLASCTRKTDTLIGNWTADKVNVQFDENRSTPELVKQIGQMEKQNAFSITPDSILVFKGLDESFEGRITLLEGTIIYCNGSLFGQWKEGQILTQTDSPLGEIIVTYSKKNYSSTNFKL